MVALASRPGGGRTPPLKGSGSFRAFFGVIIVAAPAFILIAVFAIYMGTPHFRNPTPKRAIEAGGSVYGTFS